MGRARAQLSSTTRGTHVPAGADRTFLDALWSLVLLNLGHEGPLHVGRELVRLEPEAPRTCPPRWRSHRDLTGRALGLVPGGCAPGPYDMRVMDGHCWMMAAIACTVASVPEALTSSTLRRDPFGTAAADALETRVQTRTSRAVARASTQHGGVLQRAEGAARGDAVGDDVQALVR